MSVFLYLVYLSLYLLKIARIRGYGNKSYCVFIISIIIGICLIKIFNINSNTLFLITLSTVFCYISYFDFLDYIIFDEYNLILLFIGLVYVITNKVYLNIVTMILFYIICLIINIICNKLNKEIIGGGDLKLFSVMGLFVGVVGSMYVLLISSLIGILYYLISKNKVIPYGPFLSIAYFVVFLGNVLHII